MADVSVLEVLLYDDPIGTLTRLEGDRSIFAFNESYIADENRSVLGLRFKDPYGELITDFKLRRISIMPFFSNLLPEGHLRTYLADLAGINPVREFFLLAALGKDLSGAVTVRPADGGDWLADTSDDPNEISVDKTNKEEVMRFSLAGVQLKFSAISEASGGLTIPAQGLGGSWIVKLPSREFSGVPENEYSMMTLARLVGMDVPAIELVNTSEIKNLPAGVETLGGQAFAIERFDRLQDGGKVQVEDFAQVFNIYPENKYKKASIRNIAEVIGIEGDNGDVAEFIRRLTFNTLIGNADMHLKNWSLYYPDRRNAAIAPAYDFVSTIHYIPDEEAGLKFSRTKRFDGFSIDELKHLSAKALLSEKLVIETARETVDLFHQYWQSEKENLPLSNDIIKSIENHLKVIPIAAES
ncbi:MAG: type II toxin-antitoxin system HipA family toxin [Acidiferrobacterales bacterium]